MISMADYLVFARRDLERALECVGEVTADSEARAREEAIGSHEGVVEMVLVPRGSARWVVRANEEAGSGAR